MHRLTSSLHKRQAYRCIAWAVELASDTIASSTTGFFIKAAVGFNLQHVAGEAGGFREECSIGQPLLVCQPPLEHFAEQAPLAQQLLVLKHLPAVLDGLLDLSVTHTKS